jgi:hypothetical protein
MRGVFMSRINAPLIIAFGLTLAGVVSAANAVPIATTASAATSVSTGTIIAYPSISTTGANPNGTALTLANTSLPQYFYVLNSGSIEIVSVTITISYSSTTAKKSFLHCGQYVLFAGTNTCASGIPVTVAGSGAVTLNLTPGSWYAFEIDAKKVVTPTISVSVSSAQIRAAINSNS